MTALIRYRILFLLSLSISAYSAPLAHSSPLMAFFFDAEAFSVDMDGDGGDDYIVVRFDVDIDEDVTSVVTVMVILYDQTGSMVSTGQTSYTVTGQEEGYASLNIIPSPNIEGEYYIHLILLDLHDELYIDDIYYNPESGSHSVAYFADIVKFSEMDGIELELDVNMVQQVDWSVSIDAELMDSSGEVVASQALHYMTSFEDIDYKQLSFAPSYADAYSVILLVYPEGSLIATDSRIVQILWPPGAGAYFSDYEASAFEDHIELLFDVDLSYNITYAVSVEAILYDSNSDVVGYDYTTYLTNGTWEDQQVFSLVPEPALPGEYYAELIVYTDGYPASYGYIEQIDFGGSGWDINGDGAVDAMDLHILCVSFGETTAQLEYPGADINRDGVVNLLDLIILAVHMDR